MQLKPFDPNVYIQDQSWSKEIHSRVAQTYKSFVLLFRKPIDMKKNDRSYHHHNIGKDENFESLHIVYGQLTLISINPHTDQQ